MRAHYVKARVKVRDYPDGSLAILHGPRCLARYDAAGRPIAAPTAPSLASCSPPSRRGLEAPGVCRTQSATASLDRISTRGQGQAAGRDEETGFQVEQRNWTWSYLALTGRNGAAGRSAFPRIAATKADN